MDLNAARAAELEHTAGWRRWLAKGRGRWLGIIVATLLAAALLVPDGGPVPPLRYATFDSYQLLFPRERRSSDPVVVEIDDDSLAAVGQWPWPRNVLAELIERIAAREPRLIAIDIMFAEADRASPEHLAQVLRARDPVTAQHLARLKPNDNLLGEAVGRARVVVGAVGVSEPTPPGTRLAPSKVSQPPPPLQRYAGMLSSLPQIDGPAAGRGLLNVEPERGIIRRVPVAAFAGETPVLSLGAEAVRIANKAPFFSVSLDEHGLARVGIGDREVIAQPDGRVWVYFSEPGERSVSAAQVLAGKDDPAFLKDKIVLLGVTAQALLDRHTNPRGHLMPGIQIHAQLIENILEGSSLKRPVWGRFLEALAFAFAAGFIVMRAPHARPRRAFAFVAVCWLLLAGMGIGAFWWGHVLLDVATPIAALTVLYGVVLSTTLVASDVERRALEVHLQAQREAAARVTGELEAAQRIQTGILPTRDSALKNERRVDVFTHMKPAREVGGDLYDFFTLPGDKFFVMEGDVSGKGLPAAMFMAVSKAVAKSCALRADEGAAAMMRTFNREISRENPEQMFVTMVALVVDLATGEIEYCNAGHEPPLLVRRSGEALVLNAAGGPPLCVTDDYPYDAARARMEARDVLVLASDGITEAMNRDGAIYGRARLKVLVEGPERRNVDLTVLGNEIVTAVKGFEGGTESADDQTLLIVSWRGP